MSYIQGKLGKDNRNQEIVTFLKAEGFKEGTGPQGEGSMYYVATGKFTVWFALCKKHISLYAELDCGGHIANAIMIFDPIDFNDFMRAYKEAVAWAKEFI